MIRSAPLRFVVAVLAVWTGTRAWLLWPDSAVLRPKATVAAVDEVPVKGHRAVQTGTRSVAVRRMAIPPVLQSQSRVRIGNWSRVADPGNVRDAEVARLLMRARGGSPLLALLAFAGVREDRTLAAASPPLQTRADKQRRWSGYGWFFLRDGGGKGLAEAGQLGGSQLGLRIDYALTPQIAVTGRFSSALGAAGREAAMGLSWKPVPALPLTFFVERRIAVDGAGRNAFAAMAAGGLGPVDLPADFKLEAYGQAGVVGMSKRDSFIDGAATATRAVPVHGRSTISIGGGVWGAAQPGVSRLDAGPRVKVRLEGGRAAIGASLDWRQRIAGNAEPRSGLALTLDGSF